MNLPLNPRSVFWGIVLVLAALYPFYMPSHLVGLGIEILIMAIFAMSLDLQLGYTGLLNFGHAAFLGIGIYTTAFFVRGWTNNILLTLLIVLVLSGVIGFLIGYVTVHTSGLYFLIITLAFAQVIYSIVIRWSEVTGGVDGLPGILRPELGYGDFAYMFVSPTSYYYLTLGLFVICWGLMYCIVQSPFGWVLRGIRENEDRIRSMGYNSHLYKTAVFSLSAMFAGVAGMLLAHYNWFANPQDLYWTMSGHGLVIIIVGGLGTLTGPMLGAVILEGLPYYISAYTPHTHFFIGLILCVIVLYAPKGIVGTLRKQNWMSWFYE